MPSCALTCARAHTHSYALLLISGLYNPLFTGVAGFAHVVGRIIYALGYYSNPKRRVYGEILTLPALIYSAYGTVRFALAIYGQ